MHNRRSFCLAATTICFAALQPTIALARRPNHGEYFILRARYGTAAHSMDVTQQLKVLARSDHQIQITNELFGHDPARGQPKVLRISAKAGRGPTRLLEYREKESLDLSQFDGRSIRDWKHVDRRTRGVDQGEQGFTVLSASYGRGDCTSDVTGPVRRMVRRGRLDIVIANEAFDVDPAPGARKYLMMDYSVNGMRRQIRVAEHRRLSLP